jgi:excinuclease ABC subunit C
MAAYEQRSGVNHFWMSEKLYNDFSDIQNVFAAINVINCCKVNIAYIIGNIQVLKRHEYSGFENRMSRIMEISDALKEKIKKIPQKPGVYLMRDELGGVIYVGTATRLKSRVRSHFASRQPSVKDDAMMSLVRDIDIIALKSPQEAMILECQYIKEFKPKFNVSYRDDKAYPFLKVTLNEAFPRFLVTRLKKPDGALYLGPYTDAGALRKTISELERIFRIRTCSPVHPGQYDYDHCLYQKMKWCSAPCVEKISKEDYRKSVEDACQVLLGHSSDLMAQIRREMEQASKDLKFEYAAELRDRIAALEKIVGTRTRSIQKFKRISSHTEEEAKELGQVLGLDQPPHRIEAFDISNFSGKEAVGSMVHFYEGRPDKRFYRRFKIRGVVGIDDFAMIREVVGRRYRRLKEEGSPLPDLILIDGGKGQLSSALSVLGEIGVTQTAVIGLAKRYEQIVTPYGSEISLPRDSGALHLIQRIRDEAHRFAVTYHKKLRKAKLTESILDDIPGIGPSKKALLLKKFESVKAMKKATLEEIKKVSGISESLADKIYNYLHQT